MKYWNYHFYNGVFKKEQRVATDAEILAFDRGWKKFNVLYGCQECDVRLQKEDDVFAIQLFTDKHQKKVDRLQKDLDRATNQLNIIKSMKVDAQ